jgi:hypothetical protein
LTPANSIASDAPSLTTSPTENDDLSAASQSILKTSQDPSSFQDDQIPVNIEDGQVFNNLLDRIIDDAIRIVPTVTNSKSPGEKRQGLVFIILHYLYFLDLYTAPQAPNQNELTARISQKREGKFE